MIKLSDIVDIYGNKKTKTGKRRMKGSVAWSKEVLAYLETIGYADDADGDFQSPRSNICACNEYGKIVFYVKDANNSYGDFEFYVLQSNSDKVIIDNTNGLMILHDSVAVKI